MKNICYYKSSIGKLVLVADDQGLCGLYFDIQAALEKYPCVEGDSPYLESAITWLDTYFMGQKPAFLPKLHLEGSAFEIKVWQKLLEIPYGTTVSYGQVAKDVESYPRAVGGAVGRNNIPIIIPCHRVIKSDGQIGGYSGGLKIKEYLMNIEKIVL